MKTIGDAFNLARKELKLALRFKIDFFTSALLPPLIKLVPFLLIYTGFFLVAGGPQIGSHVTVNTYQPFLFLGLVASLFFHAGIDTFSGSFQNEKFWRTIESLLTTPISSSSILLGYAFSSFVKVLPQTIVFLLTAYILLPISPPKIFVVIFILLTLYVFSLAFGLIKGAIHLISESWSTIFYYFSMGLSFLSCFFYPIDVFKKLPPLLSYPISFIIYWNPIYRAVFAFREYWFSGDFPLKSFLYVLTGTIIILPLSLFLFKRLIRRFGIHGY